MGGRDAEDDDSYRYRRRARFTCYVYGIVSDGSAALLPNVQQAINDNIAFPWIGLPWISTARAGR